MSGGTPGEPLIGVDWGGTKLEAVALSVEGAIVARRRVPTPHGDYAGSIAAIAGMVEALDAVIGRRVPVGIGIPGAISRETGLVMNANSTWNIGQPLDRDLEAALARPVRVENDANCFAVSEAVDGAGRGEPVVWGVIIGTGVGSGIAVNGVALRGRNSIAGEFGHNPLPMQRDAERPGPLCYCGRRACIETFVAGKGLERDHAAETGATLPAEAIVAAMRAGDPAARTTYERYVERLGRALASGINLLDPDVVVLGGGMSNVEELYRDLPAATRPHIFSASFTTPIRRNLHGDSSGVRGAAWLWKP